MGKFSRPPGTHDFLPKEMANRNYVEKVICQTFEEYGFQQIQTPLFEEFALLSAQSGEEIRKKMFALVGADRVDYALRPELTAPVCRMVAAGQLQQMRYPYKLYYVGQCVRQEPQGQDREFRQAGVELIGSESVLADAEIITIPVRILEKLKIPAYHLKIGNTGIFREIFRVVNISPQDLSEIIGDIDHLAQLREKCEFLQKRSSITTDEIESIRKELQALRRLQGKEYSGKYKIAPSAIQELEKSTAKEWLEKLPQVAEEVYQMTWKERGSLDNEICQLCLDVSKIRGNKEYVINKWEKLARETAVQAKQDLLYLCDWLDRY
ncbi:ATP phosphoribosyltransferase regulatory subunit, partial [Candidatus Poribacteria bacterium]|nr:ATP phosphoribosyltransferase regulatory subunit [Candidatus Poribacteria bacterium]